MVRTVWAYINVQAEDEESAIETAQEYLPEMCAHCVGWGQAWSVDDDAEWLSPDTYYGKTYSEEAHGKTAELILDKEKVVNDD